MFAVAGVADSGAAVASVRAEIHDTEEADLHIDCANGVDTRRARNERYSDAIVNIEMTRKMLHTLMALQQHLPLTL